MGAKRKSSGILVHEAIECKGLYRLIWFGAVEKVASPYDTPRIHVYLESLRGRRNVRKGSGDSARRQIRSGLVPIGELVDLYLNAVIRDGVVISSADQGPRLDRWEPGHRLDFGKDDVQIIRRDHRVDGQLVLPAERRILPQGPEANGFLLAVRVGDDPFGLLIPCTEIARFLSYCQIWCMAG